MMSYSSAQGGFILSITGKNFSLGLHSRIGENNIFVRLDNVLCENHPLLGETVSEVFF